MQNDQSRIYIYTHTYIDRERQTDRQTETETDRQRERESSCTRALSYLSDCQTLASEKQLTYSACLLFNGTL